MAKGARIISPSVGYVVDPVSNPYVPAAANSPLIVTAATRIVRVILVCKGPFDMAMGRTKADNGLITKSLTASGSSKGPAHSDIVISAMMLAEKRAADFISSTLQVALMVRSATVRLDSILITETKPTNLPKARG